MSIHREYEQWLLVDKIAKTLKGLMRGNRKNEYEISNILERWLISTYNKFGNINNSDADINMKAINEITEKRIFSKGTASR